MKMRVCPPDQFTISKDLEIVKKGRAPYTIFYTTINSHFPFDSPLEVNENWKKLNDTNHAFKTTLDGDHNILDRYALSIDYTLNCVFDIVDKNIQNDDIFILYGDHQPTALTDEKYGKETQMHIFSRDENFIKEWNRFGYKKGIIPEAGNDHIKFEGFYSALMTCLNKCYGTNPDLKIPDFKNGLDFPKIK